MTQLYTLQETAEMLRISHRTMQRLIAGGEIGGCRVGGQWRFTERQIKDYLRSAEQERTSASDGRYTLQPVEVGFAPSAIRAAKEMGQWPGREAS